MSAAQSDLVLQQSREPSGVDTPRHRALPGSSLEEIVKASNKPLIAVDMDDVLSETNEAVMECMYCVLCSSIVLNWRLQGTTMHTALN